MAVILHPDLDKVPTASALLPIALAAWALYVLALYTYRLFFHPLAKFPGPKLAGVTRWYEAYYEIVLKGQYTFKIRDLHARYGKGPDHSDSEPTWRDEKTSAAVD